MLITINTLRISISKTEYEQFVKYKHNGVMIQTEKHNSYIYIYKLLFFENMITNEKLQGYVCAVVFSEIVFINNSFFFVLVGQVL